MARGPGPQFPATPPLVGRERELTMLRDALSQALVGRGSLVLIGGEAGIGKTALAETICVEAAQQGALVLVGRCYDLSETPPYGPWAELLARAPRAGRLPPSPDLTGGGAANRAALFVQVRDFLVALAAQRPLVLLLDDLHWADAASLDLLRGAARGLADVPILLLATYRADEINRRHPLYQLLPILVREARAARIDLHPLADQDLRDLLARYALPAADRDHLAAYLRAQAEGNPFYAGELLRALEEAGILSDVGGAWALGDLLRAGVPPLLRQVIDARVDRLGEEARTLLALAAVIGQQVPLDLWHAVGDVAEEALLAVAETATEARLLVETETGVRFAHALVREALYAGLSPLRRRTWHRRAGETLIARHAPEPDTAAYHFRQAGDPRAAEWLVAAGERARRAYAWVTAAERYDAALALLEAQGADALTRARLLHTLALLLRYTDRPRSIGLLVETAALAAKGGRADFAAAARFDRGHLLCLSGNLAAGLPELRATLPVLEALLPDQLAALPTAVVLGLRPGEAYHRGVLHVYLAVSGHIAEVAAGAEALAWGPATSSRALGALGELHSWRGEPTLAMRAYTAAAAIAQAAGQYVEVGTNLYLLALALAAYRTDDLASRAALTAEVVAFLPAAREADRALTTAEILSPLLLIAGEWDEIARWGATQPNRTPWYLVSLVELARLQGDVVGAWARVRAILPSGTATVPGTVNLLVGLALERVAAILALEAGQLPEARAWLEARDRWLAWSGAVLGRAEGRLGWAAYHRAAGDLAQAREHAEAALAHAMEPRQPLSLIAAYRLLGELDTATGQYIGAQSHLDAALALAETCDAPYERALTLLAVAELRAAGGKLDDARAPLEEAQVVFRSLGARPALARTEALDARLDAPVSVTTPTSRPFGLSAREIEVLRLVAEGLSDAQAAERLFLSPFTVKAHLRSVYNKTGAPSRTAAALLAREHGLA